MPFGNSVKRVAIHANLAVRALNRVTGDDVAVAKLSDAHTYVTDKPVNCLTRNIKRIREAAGQILRHIGMSIVIETTKGLVTVTGDEIARAILKLANAKIAGQKSPLVENFIRLECYAVAGERILFADFYDRFVESLDRTKRREWDKQRLIKAIPAQFPYGRHTGNRRYIGNLSWGPVKSTRPRFEVVDARLRLAD